MDHGALFDETLCGLLVVTRCLQTVEDCICTLARSAIGYIAFTTDLLSSPKHRAWKLGDSSSAATKCPSTMLQLLSQASRLWDKRKNGNHQVPSGTISYPLMLLILAMFQDLPAVKYLKSWIHCVPPAPLSTFIAHHHLHCDPKAHPAAGVASPHARDLRRNHPPETFTTKWGRSGNCLGKSQHSIGKKTISHKEDPSGKSPFLIKQFEPTFLRCDTCLLWKRSMRVHRSSPYPNLSAPSHAPFTPITMVGLMQGGTASSIKGPYHPATQLLPARMILGYQTRSL